MMQTSMTSRLSRRAAAPMPRARPGRSVVRPLAQMPQRQPGAQVTDYQHREDRLLGLADEFVRHWISGVKEGPTEQVIRCLNSVTSTDLDVQSVKPLGKTEFKGMDGLRDMLTLEANREGAMLPTRIAIAAADETDDVVFALLEGEASMRGPLTSSQKREGGDLFHHRAYGLVKLDTLLDDTACQVTAVNERWQVAPADIALLANALPFAVGETPETNNKEVALKKTLDLSGAELFPKDRLKAIKVDREAAKESMKAWCDARCTGKDENSLLAKAFDQTLLRTWDVQGVLPLVCGMKRGKEYGATPTDTIFNYSGTMEFVRGAKATNDIQCSMIDSALARDYNVGFVHWKSHVTAKGAGDDQEHVLEGMDMHVFNEQGKITDIWMLRDPTKPEQDVLAQVLGPRKAAQHVQSHKN